MPHFRSLLTVAGLLLACGVYVLCVDGFGLEHAAAVTAAVTSLCGLWWCTEVIPIPVTSLLPFVVFPMAGVLDHRQLAEAYGDKFVLLFMAGFMISRAAERSQTHLRVSHGLMNLLGTKSQRRIVLGFLVATAFSSMWISNTATALIMLPVAIAVLAEQNDAKLNVPLLLAVAYGSSIGGIATIIGTPPNGIFVSIYEQQNAHSVDFISWLKIGVPVALIMLVAAGVLLTRGLSHGSTMQLQNLGPWTSAQRRVLGVISLTALLWITRSAPMGGWSFWLDMPMAHDATVGLAAVVALFLIPSGKTSERPAKTAAGPKRLQADRLLDWETARDIPWGILILFGGGLAIAKAAEVTGLSQTIGGQFAQLSGLHPLLLIGVICLTVTFLTEVTSNTATTTLLMPILGAVAEGAGYDAAVLMVPAALSASCAFMLPVATPPNAIVFGSEQLTVREMARAGLALNLIGVVVISVSCYFLVDFKSGIGTAIAPPDIAMESIDDATVDGQRP
ncbi:Sodium-dependent dicarboxylate transporter SdcS [Novipirellula galeiformis]|uniref:Sodium-dependent dicarboxylate transporter SdcS n=1 Tax=Novipirellula galeiformis TaxID=2528004 RepID=A0A5C6CCM0_9BACT|nr:SLC13 family permease [Novipirellula galeiformis]TWU21517.1 Sodium-dependent dicarboxylate transporter SdcS [Novipirellula galeiformis]